MLRSALLIVVAAIAVRHRAIVTQGDFLLRAATWWRLVNEYESMKAIYDQHVVDGFFVYGEPASSFEAVDRHPAFLELLESRRLNGGKASPSSIQFIADGATLPTYLPVEEGAGAALGMLGLALADLWTLRKQPAQQVSVSQVGAALSTAGYMFLEVAPHAATNYVGCRGFEGTIAQEGVVNPVRKAYQVGGDGSWVFLHGGFPKLKKGILKFLNVSEDVGGGADKVAAVEAISAAVGSWSGSGVELEAAMQQAGLAATRCRTPAEWRATEQGKLVAALPPVGVVPGDPVFEDPKAELDPRSRQLSFRRLHGEDFDDGECKRESPPSTCGRWRRLKDGAPRPLSDVIALDFSHVIASPMVGRTLAEHGALVLKVVTQKRPRRALFDEETNNGKHVIELDLDLDDDRARLHALMGGADVLIDGYTDGVLGRHGFGEREVATRYPDLVRVRVSCYGHVGPLRGAKGFQQNANFATGVATVADEANLGYQLVSQVDYATGYLGALGAVLALTDRQLLALEEDDEDRNDPDRARRTSRENGENGPRRGAIVRASLCQTATWMAKFGARMPTRSDFVWRVTRLMFGLGDKVVTEAGLTYLPPHESLMMSHTPPARLTGFHRWWTDGTVGKL